jgi:hypothetical protein
MEQRGMSFHERDRALEQLLDQDVAPVPEFPSADHLAQVNAL